MSSLNRKFIPTWDTASKVNSKILSNSTQPMRRRQSEPRNTQNWWKTNEIFPPSKHTNERQPTLWRHCTIKPLINWVSQAANFATSNIFPFFPFLHHHSHFEKYTRSKVSRLQKKNVFALFFQCAQCCCYVYYLLERQTRWRCSHFKLTST